MLHQKLFSGPWNRMPLLFQFVAIALVVVPCLCRIISWRFSIAPICDYLRLLQIIIMRSELIRIRNLNKLHYRKWCNMVDLVSQGVIEGPQLEIHSNLFQEDNFEYIFWRDVVGF